MLLPLALKLEGEDGGCTPISTLTPDRATNTCGTVLPDTECRADRPATVRLGSLGIILRWSDGASAPTGWTVETIAEGGYADVAGIREGDVVTAVDGALLDGVAQQSILERISLDDGPQLVTLRRDGQSRLVVMTDR